MSTPIETLKVQRAEKVSQKMVMTGQIQLPGHSQQSRKKITSAIRALDAEMSALNVAICKAAMIEQAARIDAKSALNESGPPLLRQIIEIRDEYQIFASDGTRSPTMRRMASELVGRLSPIIRKAINNPDH